MTQRLHQTFKDKSTPTYPQLEERKLKGVHERSRSLPFVTSQRQKSNPAKIGYGNHWELRKAYDKNGVKRDLDETNTNVVYFHPNLRTPFCRSTFTSKLSIAILSLRPRKVSKIEIWNEGPQLTGMTRLGHCNIIYILISHIQLDSDNHWGVIGKDEENQEREKSTALKLGITLANCFRFALGLLFVTKEGVPFPPWKNLYCRYGYFGGI